MSDKNTLLLQASKQNSHVAVLNLLAEGANPNTTDDEGITVLIWAASRGNMEVVKHLLDNSADVNLKGTESGVTALWMASQNGHTEIVKLLLDKGADVNVRRTTDGATALTIALKNGHSEVVKLLWENGADVNVMKTSDGSTSLLWASRGGHTEIVRHLIDKGADINAKNNYGENALLGALRCGQIGAVKLLLDKGADVNAKDNYGENALLGALRCGQIGAVKLLLDKGADVNAKDNGGVNALWIASRYGHIEIVKLLLDMGAKVNVQKTKTGPTALMAASQNGYTEIVKLLLDKGSEVNTKQNESGETALMKSSWKGQTKVVKLLLDEGADVNATGKDGATALMIASQYGHTEVVKLLEAKVAGVNVETSIYDSTTLMKGYGLAPETPICTGIGPRGANRYFGHLRCPAGQSVSYTRMGSIEIPKASHAYLKNGVAKPCSIFLSDSLASKAYAGNVLMIDRYCIKCGCGKHKLDVYVDMYDIAADCCIGVPEWTFVMVSPNGRTLRAESKLTADTGEYVIEAPVKNENVITDLKISLSKMNSFAKKVCYNLAIRFFLDSGLLGSNALKEKGSNMSWAFILEKEGIPFEDQRAIRVFGEYEKIVLETAASLASLALKQAKPGGRIDAGGFLDQFDFS